MAERDELRDLIVIKRRMNTEPEVPKGGVWKIAFADFMTAMMCFFLVMWLINAANEETRQAVASYFNPIRLAELNRKGIQDPHVTPETQQSEGERTSEIPKPEETRAAAASSAPAGYIPRDALFSDPYRVLSELAQRSDAPSGDGEEGGTGGDAFRDPFDPAYHNSFAGVAPAESDVASEQASASSAPRVDSEEGSEESSEDAVENQTRPSPSAPETEAAPAQPDSTPVAASPAVVSTEADAESQEPVTPRARPESTPAPEDSAEEQEQLRAELQSEIEEAVREEGAPVRTLSATVESTGEGLLISLTDDADFGMFAIGSAEPQPEMIRIMERIGVLLQDQTGTIVIRGHTDARPFRTAAYDNWRLSTDRAQMAYYMLVRSGLDEMRVESIEGFADRRLRVETDPEAAENRRIEILLRGSET